MAVDWFPALSFAVLGRVPPGLTGSEGADVGTFLAELHRVAPAETAGLAAAVRSENWPHPVPEQVRAGIGYAQLAALIEGVRRHVDREQLPQRVIASRPLTAEERRWQADVPPHHGS